MTGLGFSNESIEYMKAQCSIKMERDPGGKSSRWKYAINRDIKEKKIDEDEVKNRSIVRRPIQNSNPK